jgi:thiol-disulfide isomerase/thioredoxin
MARTPSNMLPLGTKAPDFKLIDTVSDQILSLDKVKGHKGTVIMFICNHCPFVKHVNSMVSQLAKEYISKGIGFVAISSNDVENYPDDAPHLMKQLAQEEGFDFPYLYDEDQQVAKAYDAACTPDFYLFDKNLNLVYRGQLDDSRPENEAVFNTAAEVLANGDSLMMFPEANHNLKRKVRPLSKGFTRVVFRTLELYPKTSLHLAPVGFNYQKASHFPDRVAIYFGETIDVTSILEKPQSQENVNRLKNAVFESLKTLTVHIDDDANYEGITNGLEAIDTDYTHPLQVNEMIVSGNWKNHCSPPVKKHKSNLLAYLFYAANFPYLLLWWGLFKKKVPEIEFTDTFRFMYMLLFYPLYYLITVGIISTFWEMNFSLLFMVSHMLFNFLYVKLAPYVT